MAGQAQRAVVRAAQDFPVGDLVITVGQIEGTVQMIVTRDGWVPGQSARSVLCNEFAGPDVPGQLEALAAHIRAIFERGQA